MNRPWFAVVGVVVGLGVAWVGWMMLTTWVVGADRLSCGSPLDNPGWTTGVPCHGAINRRTAGGWTFVLVGFGLGACAVLLWHDARRRG